MKTLRDTPNPPSVTGIPTEVYRCVADTMREAEPEEYVKLGDAMVWFAFEHIVPVVREAIADEIEKICEDYPDDSIGHGALRNAYREASRIAREWPGITEDF